MGWMFKLTFTDNALGDLRYLKAAQRNLVLDRIGEQLTSQPMIGTHNRKPLEPNLLARWELRVGTFRVFYDPDATANEVTIKAVGWKEHNKLFIRGKEYVL